MAYTLIQSLIIAVLKLTEKKKKKQQQTILYNFGLGTSLEHSSKERKRSPFFLRRGWGYRVDCLGQIGEVVIKSLHFCNTVFYAYC